MGRRAKSGQRSKSGRLSRAFLTVARDTGTPELVAKKLRAVNGAADPALSVSAASILFAHGVIDRDQHHAALAYHKCYAITFGDPWRRPTGDGRPLSDEAREPIRRDMADMMAVLDYEQTHTRRRGRLYRYYVCLGASRRGHDTCAIRSIAASEVEKLVLGQVRRLLASPEMVARTITAARRENGAAEDTEFEEGDVIEALAALEPVWDELYPAEQARILRLLIGRIDVAPDDISITVHAFGIRSLVAELADQEPPAPAASEALLEAAEQ
jgi:hypothetical protein